MKSMADIANKLKFKSKIVKQVPNLYCDKCKNTYTFYKFEPTDKNPDGYEYRDGCTCEIEALAIQQQQNYQKKLKRKRSEDIFNNSIISEELKASTFDNYEPETDSQKRLVSICQRYVENFDLNNKQSLLIQGDYGLGKSHLAMATSKAIKAKGYTVLFMDVPQLITTYKDTYNKTTELTERQLDQIIAEVDLLVLDDYGTSVTQFGNQKLFEVMTSRSGKHNIITTNNTSNELTRNKDLGKTFSRMMRNTTPIKVEGEDYRLKGLREW